MFDSGGGDNGGCDEQQLCLAMVLIVVAVALRSRITDAVLAIAIGVGVAFIVVGLFQIYGRKSVNPPN
jgi:hypothetical protein